MEWNSLKGAFEKEKPKPSPSIQVELELMKVEHKRLGSDCRKDAKGTMHAITDTGCQTTTSGTEILKVLNIPMSSLLKTRHSIIGNYKQLLGHTWDCTGKDFTQWTLHQTDDIYLLKTNGLVFVREGLHGSTTN